MNEQLLKFIELCLIDGVISDKEREVIFRKAKELGVPDDECEIILDSMVEKYSENTKRADVTTNDVTSNNNDNSLNEETVLKIEKQVHADTPDNIIREIFESSPRHQIQNKESKIDELEKEIKFLDKEIIPLEEKFEFINTRLKKISNENRKLKNFEFDKADFENKFDSLINKLDFDRNNLNFEFSLEGIKLYSLTKNFFGKKTKGEVVALGWGERFNKNDFESKFYLSKTDLKLIFDIKELYENQLNEEQEKVRIAIEKNNESLEQNNLEYSESIDNLTDLRNQKDKKLKLIDELNAEIIETGKIISEQNYIHFKKLYNESPILYQSQIFSKYLHQIGNENPKQVENLTRFLNFIIKKERGYSKKITSCFDKLSKNELTEDELSKLFNQKKNLITLYNSFHIMYQSVISKKMGLYMRIYVELETTGIFNTFYEKSVLNKLDIMNEHFIKLNNTVSAVCKEISKTNDYLSLLNQHMYNMNLSMQVTNLNLGNISSSINETNLNLQDISYSINEGNTILERGNDLLEGIDSGIGLNNLLTGVQTYQLYKINKNTKSIG